MFASIPLEPPGARAIGVKSSKIVGGKTYTLFEYQAECKSPGKDRFEFES
jgi:hypothetical protein